MTDSTCIRSAVKKLRREKKITTEDLARRYLSQRYPQDFEEAIRVVGEAEAGAELTISQAFLVARALDVDPSQLFRLID